MWCGVVQWTVCPQVRRRLVQAACDMAAHLTPLGVAMALVHVAQQPAYLPTKAQLRSWVLATIVPEGDTTDTQSFTHSLYTDTVQPGATHTETSQSPHSAALSGHVAVDHTT